MPDYNDFVPMNDDELDDVTLPDVLGSTPDAPVAGDVGDVGEAPEPVGPTYAEVEEQPEELEVTDMYELIPIAIEQRRLLQITYTGVHSGMMKDYVIEPYEIGGHRSIPAGFLWGFDVAVGSIKSFYLSNLSDIQLLDTTYVPRWS